MTGPCYYNILRCSVLSIVLFVNLIIGQDTNIQKPSIGFDTLAGPLPKIVKAKGNPYIIISDIEVPPNRIVTIEPGVVFLFKNFTGFHIQGKLIAKGTKSQPIIFSSEFDRSYNPESPLLPNPYDWNGIYIHEDAFGTMISHCSVSYTVYGIISDSKFIRLDQISFSDNGKMNLKIEDKEHSVTDKPYSYTLSVADATIDGVQINLLKDPLAPRRNIMRYSSLVATISGIGLGVYYAIQFNNSWDKWKKVNDANYVENNPDILTNNLNYWDEAKSNKNRDLSLTSIGFGVGLLGTIGFVWSFNF